MCALATLGYFNMTYRLPHATLARTMGMLLVVLPAWFVTIGNRPRKSERRAIIAGDDPMQISRTADAVEISVLGYLLPPLGIDDRTTKDSFQSRVHCLYANSPSRSEDLS